MTNQMSTDSVNLKHTVLHRSYWNVEREASKATVLVGCLPISYSISVYTVFVTCK